MRATENEIENFFHLMFLRLDLNATQAMNFFTLKNDCLRKGEIPFNLLKL